MSDAQLKDIGLHRSQIIFLARKNPPSSSRRHHAEN